MVSRILIALLIGSALQAASAKDVICADPKDALADRTCMSAEVDIAEIKLANYLDAAKVRVASDESVRLSLDEAQKAWLAYRSMQCGDVYKRWGTATYRYRASLQCVVDLTRQRTHDLWSAYLTYVDSTPAMLPEP